MSATQRPRLLLAMIVAMSALGVCRTLAAGPDPAAIATLAGPWEISELNSTRKCGLILRTDKADPAGYSMAMPAGCRRSMRTLMDVAGWTITDDRQLTFNNKAGAAILKFKPDETGKAAAPGPAGETYELVSTGKQKFALPEPPPPPPPAGFSPPRAPPVAAAKPPPAPDPAESSPVARYPGRLNDLGGRYVILRSGAPGGKDIGCMLTLDEKSRGPGGYRAQLAPACKDNGIVVFEPVGWNFVNGKLVLTARKGHKATFDYHADGGWWKDSKEGGKPLGVRHM